MRRRFFTARAVLAHILGVTYAEAKTLRWARALSHTILLTHSHWDHVSGLPDFPGVPVWVTPQVPSSHDVYGDGSIVVVPVPGHTPGGVIIFVTLHNGTRYAFVGDLVWQLEGITQREERPWITRRSADSDAEGPR